MIPLISLLAGLWGGVQNTSQPDRPGPPGRVYGESDIAALVDGLKSPVWRIRENATSSLTQLGPRVYPQLREAFAKDPQYELRRRIKGICRETYLFEKFGAGRAFLGISHNRQSLRNSDDPRIPPGCTALVITDIFTGSAADRAGLRAGDLFISLNGSLGTLQDPAPRFTEWIAGQQPGTPCRIGVIRGGSAVLFDEARSDIFRHQQFLKAKVEVVHDSDDARVPRGFAGMKIMDPESIDPRLKLKAGDLIIALNDELIPAANTLFQFTNWAKRGAGTLDENESANKPAPGTAIPAKEKATAQVLRGGERLELQTILGQRPLYLLGYLRAQGSPPPWNVAWDVVDQALSDFETWFSDTFDASRSFEERAGDGSSWMLDPGHGAE